MANGIVRPPKLYLDTNHLINIAKVRQGVESRYAESYAFIDDCICKRHLGIIFNYMVPLEWVEDSATRQSANQIAGVIDAAPLKYLLEAAEFVYTSEVLRECTRCDPQVDVPDLPILQLLTSGGRVRSALGTLVREVRDYLDRSQPPDYLGLASCSTEVPVASAREYVEHASRFKQRRPDDYRERVEGYKAALAIDIERYNNAGRMDSVAWMKRFLKIDRILAALNPGLDVDAVLARVEVDRCPAVRLWFKARLQRVKAGQAAEDNEVDDWLFLAVVPYADVVLADRGFRHFIVGADRILERKVFSDPDDAMQALQGWT